MSVKYTTETFIKCLICLLQQKPAKPVSALHQNPSDSHSLGAEGCEQRLG